MVRVMKLALHTLALLLVPLVVPASPAGACIWDSDTLAAEALLVLERRKITSIVVVDGGQRVQGVVHLHHLWRTEMF